MCCPLTWAYAGTFGATLLCRNRSMVSSAGRTRWHHRERGNQSSPPLRMETKWFLNVWIACLAMLQHWQSGFYLPPPPPDQFLCTSPTYRVALVPFHQKRCYRPYLWFYHASPLAFRTFSLPPSTTETTFTLLQFGQSKLL